MEPPDPTAELQILRKQVEALRIDIETLEIDALKLGEEILLLRDEVTATQLQQQELRATRARPPRFAIRSLVRRILNRA